MTARQRGWLLPPASFALVAGVFLGKNTTDLLLPLFTCVLLLAAVFLLRGRYRFTACILFSAALGVSAGSIAYHPVLPPEARYNVKGVISDEVTTGSFGQYRLYLSDVTLDGHPLSGGAYWTFYSDEEQPDLLPGKAVAFSASLYHPRGAEIPDSIDFRDTLLQRGIPVGLYGAPPLFHDL